MVDLIDLLTFTTTSGASDLHLSAGAPPIVRVDGRMRKLDLPVLSGEQVHRLIFDLMTDEQRRRYEERLELDFSREIAGVGRFRINVFHQSRGEAAVLRSIPTEIRSCEALGLPPVVESLSTRERGLVLVTGPTGSGKSTTLAAMIDRINRTMDKHIVTIEEPIEFIHMSQRSLINQREVGAHTHSFANALRSALREDPDVILVGEMRDPETIHLALTAAETGHLVFGTLHTSGAAQTVTRIVDVFPAEEQSQVRAMLAGSVQAILSQVLLRRKEGRGRVAAVEVLIGTPAVQSLIREGKVHQIYGLMETGSRFGMQTLDMALRALVERGIVDAAEAANYVPGPKLLGAGGARAADRPRENSKPTYRRPVGGGGP